MRNILVAAMATLAFSGIADARMYKCTDPNGSVTYSERPCVQGAQRAIKLYDNSFAAPTPSAQTGTNDDVRRGMVGGNSGSRAGAQSNNSSGGKGKPVWAQKGMSMAEVRAKLGNPDARDEQATVYDAHRKCDNLQARDVWMYSGGNGNLGQKITFCDSTVVEVEPLTAGSKHAARPGSNRTGHTGGSVTAQRGWSRTTVMERMGPPDSKKLLDFSGNSLCRPGDRGDEYVYLPRGGNRGQRVMFCNDAVVNVEHI